MSLTRKPGQLSTKSEHLEPEKYVYTQTPLKHEFIVEISIPPHPQNHNANQTINPSLVPSAQSNQPKPNQASQPSSPLPY